MTSPGPQAWQSLSTMTPLHFFFPVGSAVVALWCCRCFAASGTGNAELQEHRNPLLSELSPCNRWPCGEQSRGPFTTSRSVLWRAQDVCSAARGNQLVMMQNLGAWCPWESSGARLRASPVNVCFSLTKAGMLQAGGAALFPARRILLTHLLAAPHHR